MSHIYVTYIWNIYLCKIAEGWGKKCRRRMQICKGKQFWGKFDRMFNLSPRNSHLSQFAALCETIKQTGDRPRNPSKDYSPEKTASPIQLPESKER